MPSNTPPEIAQDLLDFIDRSPTPFHATQNLVSLFAEAGYEILDEGAVWKCQTDKKYLVTRNGSSIIAFNMGAEIGSGMRMVGAHTDSPCLRIKPNPEINAQGYLLLGVEVYGGALLHPWLDRDLSIAGRVSGVNKQGELFSQLIDLVSPIGIIPNLAIHLNRSANTDNTVNPQTDLPVVIGQKEQNFKELLLSYCDQNTDRILDFELSCYDTQSASFIGLNQEFIAAARLDNLLSSYVAARALIDGDPKQSAFYISTDHEEVGSASACGAQGPFLRSVLERLTDSNSELTRAIGCSSFISCDNAHGIHPSHPDKHDENHGPKLNKGPVVKVNAKQRYASNSISSARFLHLCEKENIPTQHFVTRADMGCGSTIGPIIASGLGIETLDIGVPQWGMHSIRETAGTQDVSYMYDALKAYLNE